MSQATTAPQNFKPASCPLLAAILPVRYAIGAVTSEKMLTSIDAAALGLPPASGNFPELGPDHPQLGKFALGYVPRMLRDGWLYVWQENTQELTEYQVSSTTLKQTPRGGPVLEKQSHVYLLLPAGAPSMLTWSPVRWSDPQFSAAKAQDKVRQRIMRTITPGVGPLSGPLSTTRNMIGDSTPENFRWSCNPDQKPWQLNDSLLRRMQRCEQQHYAVVDDPWGVLIDLAGLLRARSMAFDKESIAKRTEWLVASTLKELSDNDSQLRENLSSYTDYAALQSALKAQTTAADNLDLDRRRLATLWAEWLGTLGKEGPGTLESACGHMDITQPAARDMLEASFAAATLGPSATSIGAKALQDAMDIETREVEKPWLVWAYLGVLIRMRGGEIKQLLHVAENLEPLGPEAKSVRQALVLVAAINAGAAKLGAKPLAQASEAFFSAMAPVIGGHLRTMDQHINAGAMRMVQAMLARSQQKLEVEALTQREVFEKMSNELDGIQNKSKKKRVEKDIAKFEENEARVARKQAAEAGKAGAGKSPTSPVANQVKEYAHLRVVPLNPTPAPAHPAPGYGSDTPAPTPKVAQPSAADLPPMSKATEKLKPRLTVRELLNDAPLKILILVTAVWSFSSSMDTFQGNKSEKNRLAAVSASFGSGTALAAIFQQVAEIKWNTHVKTVSKISPEAQALLASALRIGAGAMLLQSATAGIDVITNGWDALDSYKAGDLDTMVIDVGLSAANMAYMRVSLQMFRAMRIARAAVILGDAAALSRGVSIIPVPLLAQTAGLVIIIFGGMVSLLYTRDTPLEAWVKQTCFGTRPATWSNSYEETMKAYYQAVAPVKMELRRWNDYNPVTGQLVKEVRLMLLLSGQQTYEQGMVSFSGAEEWASERGMLDFGPAITSCRPLVWGEDDQIPLYEQSGSRVTPEPDGALCLSAAYHESDNRSLTRISGSLTYQPVDGLYLPSIDIDLS